ASSAVRMGIGWCMEIPAPWDSTTCNSALAYAANFSQPNAECFQNAPGSSLRRKGARKYVAVEFMSDRLHRRVKAHGLAELVLAPGPYRTKVLASASVDKFPGRLQSLLPSLDEVPDRVDAQSMEGAARQHCRRIVSSSGQRVERVAVLPGGQLRSRL